MTCTFTCDVSAYFVFDGQEESNIRLSWKETASSEEKVICIARARIAWLTERMGENVRASGICIK